LRSDKLRLAALEATLVSHQRDVAEVEVPTIRMLALTADELERLARGVIEKVDQTGALKIELQSGESTVGGGAGPTSTLPTYLIAITHAGKSAQEIEQQLRTSSPPIISRISEGKVLLDLRTVFPEQLPVVLQALQQLSA
jgi:L-seryl-tRNA(Ser) seleniumtransferase